MYNIGVFTSGIFLLLSALLIRCYSKSTNKLCKAQKRLDGKTCVVTGGTSGMGLEIAKDFARRGARVIIACPFGKEGIDAQETIQKETGSDKVIFKHLNLASLESTRKFAQDILKTEERLDILINNAGIGAEDKITEDGLNFTMEINYYGHFLLTILLLPLLKKTGTSIEKARIVNTASIFHFGASFEPENMNKLRYWNLFQIYANSKLCLVLFSRELAKKLNGYNVVTNSIDPGTVGTPIFERNLGKILGFVVAIFLRLFARTPWEGAQTALHVALAKECGDTTGEYFRNCKLSKAKKISYDDTAAKLLWKESVRLVQLNDSEMEI